MGRPGLSKLFEDPQNLHPALESGIVATAILVSMYKKQFREYNVFLQKNTEIMIYFFIKPLRDNIIII